MSGPLIFVSRSKVKPGKLPAFQEHAAEAADLVEAEEPRMIAFNSYVSADGTDVATVQVHPDAASLDAHLALFFAKLRDTAFELLESYEINVYGSPSERTRTMLTDMPRQIPGLRVRVLPDHAGGFQRPQPL